MSKKKIALFAAGAAIGAGLGVLFAPRSGKETRKILKDKMDDLIAKARKLSADDVKDAIEAKVNEIKEAISDLDKETVLAAAKKQVKKIREMGEDLVEYVSEKGTPVLEKAASAVRCKAIDVTKDVLEKLEKSDQKVKKEKNN